MPKNKFKRPKPGPGFKRYSHGWGKNVAWVWVKGKRILSKKDPSKPMEFVTDSSILIKEAPEITLKRLWKGSKAVVGPVRRWTREDLHER